VRLAHVNAPELRHAKGSFARDRLAAMLAEGPLLIRTIRDRTEKYGRWLATIEVQPPGGEPFDVGAQLMAEGLATPYEGGRR
jgi:endonuclease YncB( thermonuclease family)